MSDCEWCDKGDKPKVLDKDGVLSFISGESGTLCHAYKEYWWACHGANHNHNILPETTKELSNVMGS